MSSKPKLKADKLSQDDPVDILVSRPGQAHREEEQVWVKGQVSYVIRLTDPFGKGEKTTTQCRVEYIDPFTGEQAEEHIDLTKK